jgi:hypothetical protein
LLDGRTDPPRAFAHLIFASVDGDVQDVAAKAEVLEFQVWGEGGRTDRDDPKRKKGAFDVPPSTAAD